MGRSTTIEAFRRAPTNVDRGTLFEVDGAFLRTSDPALAQQYEQVCRWIDWEAVKARVTPALIWWPVERDTGAYTAIQCKF